VRSGRPPDSGETAALQEEEMLSVNSARELGIDAIGNFTELKQFG